MMYRIKTLQQRPNLIAQYAVLVETCWPLFLYANEASRKYGVLLSSFKQHQLVLCTNKGRVIAAGNMLPIVWDGTQQGLPAGLDAALAQVAQEQEARHASTALLAVSVMVDSQYRGQGISTLMLRAMRENAADNGIAHIIAPVRPIWKSRYPFVSMQEYIGWTRKRENGEPFDPWIRTHVRIGGKLLTVAPSSMVVKGSIAEWEGWTGMRFPQSGAYAVSGALQPVSINCEKNEGLYEEPNVWMLHSVTAKECREHRSVHQNNWWQIIRSPTRWSKSL